MDSILTFKALVMGIVEGLTEFLPVSSTGHLIVTGDLLHFTSDKAKVFEIVIQLGAILAVCWEYRERLMGTVRNVNGDPAAQRFVANLFIAFIPAAVIGLALHHLITAYLFNPITVAAALIVGGIVIAVVERREITARIHSVDDMRWQDALKVGFAQSFALFPGTSRSGATIIGGMLFGMSRKSATEFSFFLAIPTMFAATFYDLLKNRDLLHFGDLNLFGIGFVAAFISAFIAVRALLHYVAHHDFTGFAWYRIVFGMLVLFYFW